MSRSAFTTDLKPQAKVWRVDNRDNDRRKSLESLHTGEDHKRGALFTHQMEANENEVQQDTSMPLWSRLHGTAS